VNSTNYGFIWKIKQILVTPPVDFGSLQIVNPVYPVSHTKGVNYGPGPPPPTSPGGPPPPPPPPPPGLFKDKKRKSIAEIVAERKCANAGKKYVPPAAKNNANKPPSLDDILSGLNKLRKVDPEEVERQRRINRENDDTDIIKNMKRAIRSRVDKCLINESDESLSDSLTDLDDSSLSSSSSSLE
jgi:hypothetical protein